MNDSQIQIRVPITLKNKLQEKFGGNLSEMIRMYLSGLIDYQDPPDLPDLPDDVMTDE